MNKTKIKQKTINHCAKYAPKNSCEKCRCTEAECIKSLYENLCELEMIESEENQ